MRAFILPLRLALAVFGTVALTKLMPGVVRAEDIGCPSFPPPVVQRAEVPAAGSCQATSGEYDHLLMPIHEERDLERWLEHSLAQDKSQTASQSRTSFTYPEPISGYQDALGCWEHQVSGTQSPEHPDLAGAKDEDESAQILEEVPEEDYYTYEYWEFTGSQGQSFASSGGAELECSADDYPVPVIEEDPQPAWENEFSSSPEAAREDWAMLEDPCEFEMGSAQEEDLCRQEEASLEEWDTHETGEADSWYEEEEEEYEAWDFEEAMKDGVGPAEDFAEETSTDLPELDAAIIEETGGVVLLEEPADSWRWYDFRNTDSELTQSAVSPGVEASCDEVQRLTESTSLPNGHFSDSVSDPLPEVYDPWCYYAYGVHEITENLEISRPTEEETSSLAFAEYPEREDAHDQSATDEGAMVYGASEEIADPTPFGQSPVNPEWTTSPVFDWDTSLEFQSTSQEPGAETEQASEGNSGGTMTASEANSEFESSWEFSGEPWIYRSPWEYPGPTSEESSGAVESEPVYTDSDSAVREELFEATMAEEAGSKYYYHYGWYEEQAEIFEKPGEQGLGETTVTDEFGNLTPETLDSPNGMGDLLGEIPEEEETLTLEEQEEEEVTNILSVSPSEANFQPEQSESEYSYEYEYWPYREDESSSNFDRYSFPSTQGESPEAVEDFAGDQGLVEDDLYWYHDSLEEQSLGGETTQESTPAADWRTSSEEFSPADVLPNPEEISPSIALENVPDSPVFVPEETVGEVFEEGGYPVWPTEDPIDVGRDIRGDLELECDTLEADEYHTLEADLYPDDSGETQEIPAEADMDWYGFEGEETFRELQSSAPADSKLDLSSGKESEDLGASSEQAETEDLFWSESSWQIAALREQYGRAMGLYPAANSEATPSGFAQQGKMSSEPLTEQFASEDEGLCRSGISLFAEHPADLLNSSDWEILQYLNSLQGDDLGAAAACLDEYLNTMGWHVYELTYRVEAARGISRIALARDLVAVSLLLATCRLVEKGELGIEEAGRVLEQSLQRVPEAWSAAIENLGRAEGDVTVQVHESPEASYPEPEGTGYEADPARGEESAPAECGQSAPTAVPVLEALKLSLKALGDSLSPVGRGMTYGVRTLVGVGMDLVSGNQDPGLVTSLSPSVSL